MLGFVCAWIWGKTVILKPFYTVLVTDLMELQGHQLPAQSSPAAVERPSERAPFPYPLQGVKDYSGQGAGTWGSGVGQP